MRRYEVSRNDGTGTDTSSSIGMPRYRRIPASPSMNVIADSHEAVFTKPLSRVTTPVLARSFEMSMPRSPSVPTTMGSSVSSAPMRSTADGSLIPGSLLFAASVPLAAERLVAP